MDVNFTEFPTIFFLIFSDTFSALGVNSAVAISTAFLGAIIFSASPTTFASAGFVGLLKKFMIFFIGFYLIGYTTTVFIDYKSSPYEVNANLRLDSMERNCGLPIGTFP